MENRIISDERMEVAASLKVKCLEEDSSTLTEESMETHSDVEEFEEVIRSCFLLVSLS